MEGSRTLNNYITKMTKNERKGGGNIMNKEPSYSNIEIYITPEQAEAFCEYFNRTDNITPEDLPDLFTEINVDLVLWTLKEFNKTIKC